MSRRRRCLTVAALGAITILVPACADDDSGAGSPTTAPSAAPSTTVGSPATTPQVVEVAAVDFRFDHLPERVSAGSRLTLVNESGSELHELVAFRLADDEERSVEELMALPPDELMATLGQPATVLLATPGGEQIPAVGDGTLSEAGRYAVICSIPTGVDPDEYLAAAAASQGGPPQVAGGPPHLVHGMFAELTVE